MLVHPTSQITPEETSLNNLDNSKSTSNSPSSQVELTPQEDDGKNTATSRNLYVNGLPTEVTDTEFKAMFEPFGNVLSARVMLHIRTGLSRGFGFILFEQREDAEKALESLNGFEIGDSKIAVSFSEHKGQNLLVESNRLYIRNVPTVVSLPTAELFEYLNTFGVIVGIDCRSHRSDKPFGEQPSPLSDERVSESTFLTPTSTNGRPLLRTLFIQFDSNAAAMKCVEATHNTKPFACCEVPLLAKIHEPDYLRLQRLKETKRVPNPTATTPKAGKTSPGPNSLSSSTSHSSQEILPAKTKSKAGRSRGNSIISSNHTPKSNQSKPSPVQVQMNPPQPANPVPATGFPMPPVPRPLPQYQALPAQGFINPMGMAPQPAALPPVMPTGPNNANLVMMYGGMPPSMTMPIATAQQQGNPIQPHILGQPFVLPPQPAPLPQGSYVTVSPSSQMSSERLTPPGPGVISPTSSSGSQLVAPMFAPSFPPAPPQ